MAKKKVQPTPENEEIFKVDFTEDIETGVAEGTKDAKEFYTLTSINRSLNSKQVTKELNDQHTKAREKLEFYRDKVERKLLLKYTMDFYYWSSYLLTLNQNGVNGEVVKNDAPQQTLRDIFKEGKYEDFVSLIEASNISKDGRIKRKQNLVAIALAVYEYVKEKDMIIKVKHPVFCKLFSLHYSGNTMNDNTISKAYTGKKRQDFLIVEKLLKDRK